MNKTQLTLSAILVTAALAGCSNVEQTESATETQVTMDNFVQAESTAGFNKVLKTVKINEWLHQGSMANIDTQNIIRMNQDTMYSMAVVDVSKGATFTIPKRDIYQSVHVIDLNHMVPAVIYPGESITITPADLTTGEYVYLLMRTGTADYTKEGLDEARAATKAVTISAHSARPFNGVHYDEKSLDTVRNLLIAKMQNGELTQPSKMIGSNFDEVHFDSYMIAAAAGWAALPAKDAMYTPGIPGEGSLECSSFTMQRPPLDYAGGGFFSVTTYDQTGWIVKDKFALSNNQATANADGSYTFHFNCAGEINNIEVVDGWSGVIRLYKPESVEKVGAYVKTLLTTNKITKMK